MTTTLKAMTPVLAAALAGAVLVTAALPAAAQQACGARDDIVTVLRDRYAERHRASGLGTNQLIEVWASETTGTWTILVTQANGITCVAASGENWLEFGTAALEEQPS